ncbi:MAG: type II secretion system F family protein, partial [Rhodopirellula bahusiensis]
MSRQMGVRSCRDFSRRFGVGLRAGADLLKLLESEAKHGPARQRVAMTKIREGAKDGHAISEMMRHQKP